MQIAIAKMAEQQIRGTGIRLRQSSADGFDECLPGFQWYANVESKIRLHVPKYFADRIPELSSLCRVFVWLRNDRRDGRGEGGEKEWQWGVNSGGDESQK